jgi:epoxyqueuosine reductase
MDPSNTSAAERSLTIKALGLDIGFSDVGISPPGPFDDMKRFEQWLDRNYHGEMQYMEKGRQRRIEPESSLANLQSVIVAAVDYDSDYPLSTEVEPDSERGWISRYAWGDDYHIVIEKMLDEWCRRLADKWPQNHFRRYVDHGPVLEKVYARYAGIGWMGKHTNIIHPERGSWFFLAVILTDLLLAADEPLPDRCGSCTACLDACPTNAFVQPYLLDATRCISYLTIEIKGEIPGEFHKDIGQNLFGCDICQDVCPWNRKPIAPNNPAFLPRPGAFHPRLEDLEQLEPDDFRERFRHSPVKRRKLEGLKHNLQVVKGNLEG